MANNEQSLSFRVSSGLKNIIGRDLISDKFIAIFELVKNSYDAGAHKVTLLFEDIKSDNASISIIDDGCGMNYDDILNKWLFVAYSEKKTRNQTSDFREKIKRNVAGAKGVGRFSCDRLGSFLTLITKTESEDQSNCLEINWDNFEYDDEQEFIDIPVNYHTDSQSKLISKSGTILKITNLRETWDRSTLIKLKKSLMKLISPESENKDDPFSIEFNVPEMLEEDENIKNSPSKKTGWEREIVNGLVNNDVFEKLNIKTTSIFVSISEDGKTISTELKDRGEFIFKFSEKNREYTLLRGIDIKLFYMNKNAKISFTKLMGGVEPVNYGSVFIYKNGFRINPYGEPGEDFFNINQRKTQGYNRYLGTREVMGRITITGKNDGFVETSSRAHGFLSTPASRSLSEFFLQKVLKVLERYVVNIISWGEPLKTSPGKVIMPLEMPELIIKEFIDIRKRSDVITLDYNPMLLDTATEDSNSLAASIDKLERAASKSDNGTILELAKSVKKKTSEVMDQNIALERENATQQEALKKSEAEKVARQKQVFFLQGQVGNTTHNLINGMHYIYTNTEATRVFIDDIKEFLTGVDFDQKETLVEYLSEIEKANKKANKISEMAIAGTKNLKQTTTESLFDFVSQYIRTNMVVSGLKYEVSDDGNPYNCIFDPISIGIILDNLGSNSIKAHASKMRIVFREDSEFVYVAFRDDGVGLNPNIDVKTLFEYGISANATQKGFGIGLNQIKELIEEMGGEVHINEDYIQGFEIEVSIGK